MTSLNELIELNRCGDLGRMLAERFHGRIGRLDPRKDAEFTIGFAARQVTPSAQDISAAVIEHYTRLGYGVEPKMHRVQDAFEAFVFYETKAEGCIHVSISTFCQFFKDGDHNHLRATTTVI